MLATTIDVPQGEGALSIVNAHLRFPRISLIEPSSSHFLHVAAEIDKRPPFLPSSRVKRRVIAHAKEQCALLRRETGVLDASVFSARIIPPGLGEYAKQRADRLHIARFDLAVLIECESEVALQRVRQHPAYKDMERAIAEAASYVHTIAATNPRRIGPVDHKRQGVFLFNYFVADSVAQNLGVWDTQPAGSRPRPGSTTPQCCCRPSRPNHSTALSITAAGTGSPTSSHRSSSSGRSGTYVLDNFAANNVAAMPILYRLA